ncbi:MAG: ATP synthase subunit C [Sphaerochaetaceae bacterium]|jgi:V/A-type H+-transporting ATPase subunit K|nr:ATP synthase subunit C [Sphaerochaetaceae bacterium]
MSLLVFKRRLGLSVLATVLLLVVSGLLFAPPVFAAETAVQETVSDAKYMWVCIGAAVAFSAGAISAGMAISRVGTAAMGALSERPEIGSQALIFIALAEGLVVFGFITALMILGKI